MLSDKLLEFSLLGAEWVLWLLLGLSLFSVAVMIDRILLYVRTRERLPELEPELMAALQKADYAAARRVVDADSLVRNVIRAGLERAAVADSDPGKVEQAMLGALARERSRFDARLTALGTIGSNAPFIGLFGTVLGIVQAFSELQKMDPAAGSTNQYVMGALGEALVATGVGILVAIPAVAVFNWAKAHVAGRTRQAEALMRAVLAALPPSDGGQAVDVES